jgi:hypothetical protein
VASVLGASAACELLLPTHEKDDPSDAGSPQTRTESDPCVHALPPGPPGASASDGGAISFVAAMKTFGVGRQPLGFDLDGVCTCHDAGPGREAGPEACRPPQAATHCDDDNGRDFSGDQFLGEYLEQLLVNTTDQGDVDTRIDAGILSFIFEVKGYAGRDGQNVSFGLYDSSGLYEAVDGGPDASGPIIKTRSPSWDGGDGWALDCAQSEATCPDTGDISHGDVSPGFVDRAAYVNGGQLVAHLPVVVLGLGFTDLRITNALVVAKVVPVSGGYGLDGQIAGRIALHDMFRTVAAVHQGARTDNKYYCGRLPSFVTGVRPVICAALDLPSEPRLDGTGTTCDAVSIAIAFTAFPAKIQYRLDRDPIPRGCEGDAAIPDDCTQPTP